MRAVRVYADGKLEVFESRGEAWSNMMIHDAGHLLATKYFRHDATAEKSGSTPYRTMVYVERDEREWKAHTMGTLSESEEPTAAEKKP